MWTRDFFSRLHLKFIYVFYPERDEVPIDNDHKEIVATYEKIKDHFIYIYDFDFKVDSTASCEFSVRVDRFGNIIHPFDFPRKGRYIPVNKHFTYCKLIDIARKAQKHIDPIGSVELCFNSVNRRFYWFVSQDFTDKSDGLHSGYQVQIDAADLSKVKKDRFTYSVRSPIE